MPEKKREAYLPGSHAPRNNNAPVIMLLIIPEMDCSYTMVCKPRT